MQNYKKLFLNIMLSFFLVFGFILTNSFTTNAAIWKTQTDPQNDILTFYFHFKSQNNQWEKNPYLLSMKSKNNINYTFESEGIRLQTNKTYTANELKNLGFTNGFGNVFQLGDKYPTNAYQPISQKLDMVAISSNNSLNKKYSLNLCGGSTFPIFKDKLPETSSISISFELKEVATPEGYKKIDNTNSSIPKINILDDELTFTYKKSTSDNSSAYQKLIITSKKGRRYEIFDQYSHYYKMRSGTQEFSITYGNYNQMNSKIQSEKIPSIDVSLTDLCIKPGDRLTIRFYFSKELLEQKFIPNITFWILDSIDYMWMQTLDLNNEKISNSKLDRYGFYKSETDLDGYISDFKDSLKCR